MNEFLGYSGESRLVDSIKSYVKRLVVKQRVAYCMSVMQAYCWCTQSSRIIELLVARVRVEDSELDIVVDRPLY